MGHSENDRIEGLPPDLISCLDTVENALPNGWTLDCGDLFGACLLLPKAHGLLASWTGAPAGADAVIAAVRNRARTHSTEGAAKTCLVDARELRTTGLAGFFLRFLPACGSFIYPLRLLAGLAEIAPIPVGELLKELGLDLAQVAEVLQRNSTCLKPLLPGRDTPHTADMHNRYMSWWFRQYMMDPSRVSPLLDGLEDWDACVQEMVAWAEAELEEIAPCELHRAGDVTLFDQDGVRNLCVYDVGGVWRSLMGTGPGEGVARDENAVRAFRARERKTGPGRDQL